jgi:hypothetical protein
MMGMAGMAAATAAGCGQEGPAGRGGPGESAEGPPGEGSQGVVAAQVCVSIRRAGLTGAVLDTGLALKTPPKNYGASQTMATGPVGSPAVDNQVLLKFDLSAIPGGPNTTIVTAAVNLARYQPPTGVGPIDVYPVASSNPATSLWPSAAGDEGAVTWQSFSAGAALGAKETSFSNGSAFPSFGLTALVQRWVRGQLPNNGIVLREPGADVTGFWTSEYTNFYARPELYVCYTVGCSPGFADCNGNGADGCEANLGTSPLHCGACGNACSVANATAACAGGACAVGACNLGFGDCDGSAANGCETLLTTNQDCGACGVACALPHGAASCTTGTCTLTSCQAGYHDCDGNPGNGCEAMPCANLSHCASNAGCQSGVCQGGFCATPICNDGVQNGAETAVDCGGSCSPCAVGQTCNLGADCQSGVCQGGVCAAPTCVDAVANGAETATDCGGPSCPACADGLTCAVGADCQSGVCTGGHCQAPVCNDGVKNGAETAVDCGGGACPACPAGKACGVGADCLDLVCAGNICQLASCTDGVQNGTETGLDCGGSCSACVPGQPCAHGSDCQSGVCQGGVCQSPTCSDGIKNGNEVAVDCGGTCAVPEVCDGIDNDCNGLVDDGLGSTTCGVGACQVTVQNCVAGHPQTCVPLPPQVELCDGLLDDDCDGVVDNGCACTDGHTQSCYTAAPATLGVGECASGVQTCVHGQWGACVGEVTPAVEGCDGLDNDCNGQVDDGLGQTVCGVGACQVTTPNCLNGAPQTCTPRAPSAEVCDGLDNDCDGQADDNLPPITCGVGACQTTVPSCANGVPEGCTPGTPSAEGCDGLDNDCDGVVDNGNPGGGLPCSTGLPGACGAGVTSCTGGHIVCVQTVFPTAEACDGIDNDCDGVVDDGNPGGDQACGTGLPGVCAAGVTACGAGGQLTCVQAVFPTAEACDGLDNDCDGVVDNGNPGAGAACSTGLPGVCGAGSTTCAAGVLVCHQTVLPGPESCDGLDNDCDGVVDNGNPGAGAACNTGLLGACAAGTTACSAGHLACNQTTLPSAETCDGLDNDCDGVIDNGNPGAGAACSTGKLGVCAAGTTVCSTGHLSCAQSVQPSAEACDGLDNDCDGVADNGNPGGGQACSTGLLGVCAAGTTACSAGHLACNQTTQPSAETCDGLLDQNCNGQVDEGCACVNGATQACYGGAAGTQGVGVCHAGVQTCAGGQWGACAGQVLPGVETCDGLDNDCNGQVDEGLGTLSCGVGACRRTVAACAGGHAGTCTPGAPSAETCDGVDNDCDGVVDNGNPGAGAACSTGKLGVCAAGTTACTAGALVCNQGLQPTPEVCDGLDNNCDGSVDEGVKTTFYRDADGDGYGNAGVTAQACAAPSGYVGNSADCNDGNAAVRPGAAEICDGVDNNCNGQVDEGNPGGGASCGTCGGGTTVCSGGAVSCSNAGAGYGVYYRDADGDGWGNPSLAVGSCGQPGGYVGNSADCNDGNAAVHPGAAETCNGVDDNCNGSVDEGSACSCASIDGCATGWNCIASHCTPATSSCAAESAAHGSPDGEYWITPGGSPTRAYCDMSQKVALCTETQGTAASRTRDGAVLPYSMVSVLNHAAGTCSIWAVKNQSDGYPLDNLVVQLSNHLSSCQALGFIADGTLGSCAYGASYTHCGFSNSLYFRYGNLCTGCTQFNGSWSQFVLQGPMTTAHVMSSADGLVKTTCRIR